VREKGGGKKIPKKKPKAGISNTWGRKKKKRKTNGFPKLGLIGKKTI